jgi:hypothetical protein
VTSESSCRLAAGQRAAWRDVRIRQVKPAFWTDDRVAHLTYGARLFYIGLWNLADDAGYLEWNEAQVGAELFPYESPRKREKSVGAWMKELVDAKRVVLLDCGHAVVPTLGEHQRLSGPTKQVRTYFLKHERRDCPIPAVPRGSPRVPNLADEPESEGQAGSDDDPRVSPRIPAVPRTSPTRNGTVRNGKGTVRNGSARARVDQDPPGETEFQRKVPRPAGVA